MGKGTSKLKVMVKYILKPIASLIGMSRVLRYLNKLALKYDYDSSELIGGIVMGYECWEAMKKSEYIQLKKLNLKELQLMLRNAGTII